jgi:hypothetical protein
MCFLSGENNTFPQKASIDFEDFSWLEKLPFHLNDLKGI